MFIFLMHAVVQCPGKEMNWPFAASIKLLLYQHFMIYFICYLCSFFSNTSQALNITNCRKTHLPEEQVCVRAVPLLLLPSLQHHNRFWQNAIVGFQP